MLVSMPNVGLIIRLWVELRVSLGRIYPSSIVDRPQIDDKAIT